MPGYPLICRLAAFWHEGALFPHLHWSCVFQELSIPVNAIFPRSDRQSERRSLMGVAASCNVWPVNSLFVGLAEFLVGLAGCE